MPSLFITSSLLFCLVGYVACIHLKANVREGATEPISIKAYYVNVNGSSERASCMYSQLASKQADLAQLGISLEFERWPATSFGSCTTVEACMKERPECFPTKRAGTISHPKLGAKDDTVTLLRGVLGNWCSHLLSLKRMEEEVDQFDYFMIFEDDTILLDSFAEHLRILFNKLPQLWTLAALDTFNKDKKPSYIRQDAMVRTGLPLLSISGTPGQYWGGHAWVLSSSRLKTFASWYRSLPAIPFDWVPKVPRPLHQGTISYNPRIAVQRRFLTAAETQSLSRSCLTQSVSDIRGTDKSRRLAKPYARPRVSLLQTQPLEIILLGMKGSGIRVLRDLISTGIERPGDIKLCNAPFGSTSCGGVWPHTHPLRLTQLGQSRDFKNTVAVVLVRHPFSLVRSMSSDHNEEHDLDCKGPEYAVDWLKQPCYSSYEASQYGDISAPACPNASAVPCFDSAVGAWNSYVDGYFSTTRKLFNDVLFVRYEDILERPHAVLRSIAQRANVEASNILLEVNSPEQRSIKENALHKLSGVRYLSNYSARELSDFCSILERSLLFQLGYHGCQTMDPTMVAVKADLKDAAADATADEVGFKRVLQRKRQPDMKAFVKKIIENHNWVVQDEVALNGLVSFFSGTENKHSFDTLMKELRSAPWLSNRG